MPRESVHAGPSAGVGEPCPIPDRPVSDRQGVLEALRAQIRAIECDGAAETDAVPFGIGAIDRALPWGGLPRAALHAIAAGGDGGAGPLPRPSPGAQERALPVRQAAANLPLRQRGEAGGGYGDGSDAERAEGRSGCDGGAGYPHPNPPPLRRGGLSSKSRAVAEAVGGATGAATGFAAALLGRLCGGGHALWCLRRGDLYAPGLTAFGIDPARLLVVRVERMEQALWVLEEALASGRFAAVLGETAADLTASRRLQLAARDHGTACLLLDRGDAPGGTAIAGGAATALTRWRIDAAPGAASLGGGPAAAGWRVTLTRCRGGAVPREWTIGWCHETRDFLMAAALADRPSVPARLVARPEPGSQQGPEPGEVRRAG